MNHARPIALAALAALAASAVPLNAFAAGLTARLTPDTVAVGEVARLEIASQAVGRGAPDGAPEIPPVDGLTVEPAGQTTQMSIVNGAVSGGTSYVYRVTAERAGTFALSGIRQGSEHADPVTLTVTRGATGHAAAPAPAPSAAPPQEPAPSQTVHAFLRLELPKRALFTGEAVPITVRGYFPGGTGVTLDGPPSIATDAFTIGGLEGDPSQSHVSIKGEPYLAVTWHALLTAVKAGSYPLAVTLPATVQYEETTPRTVQPLAPRGRPRGGSLIDRLMNADPSADPFAALREALSDDSFFAEMDDDGEPFGRVVTRDVTLTAHPGAVTVEPLPADGRPADFNGAVGSFDVRSTLDRADLVAGEPATLDVVVSGHGNFAGVAAPGLADSPQWRAYASHATFTPTDKAGYAGTKTFEQSIVPREGAAAVPALAFSYFDPDARRYVTAPITPIAVTVAPGEAAVASGSGNAPVAGPQPAPQTASTPASHPHTALGPSVRTLVHGGVPAHLTEIAVTLVGLALLAAAAIRLRRSRAWLVHTRRHHLLRAALRHVRDMHDAQTRSDSAAFFVSARSAIQHRTAARWGLEPDAVTEAELARRWPAAPDVLREVFRLADEAEYFHRALPAADLESWMRRIDAQLAELPPPAEDASAGLVPVQVSP